MQTVIDTKITRKQKRKRHFSILDFHLPFSILNLIGNIKTNKSNSDINDEKLSSTCFGFDP